MIFLIGYYVFGLILMVFCGRVQSFGEFIAAFGWATIWPIVIGFGWHSETEVS